MKKQPFNISKVKIILDIVLKNIEQNIKENNIKEHKKDSAQIIKNNDHLVSVLNKILNLNIKIHEIQQKVENIADNEIQNLNQGLTEEDITILSNYLKHTDRKKVNNSRKKTNKK